MVGQSIEMRVVLWGTNFLRSRKFHHILGPQTVRVGEVTINKNLLPLEIQEHMVEQSSCSSAGGSRVFEVEYPFDTITTPNGKLYRAVENGFLHFLWGSTSVTPPPPYNGELDILHVFDLRANPVEDVVTPEDQDFSQMVCFSALY